MYFSVAYLYLYNTIITKFKNDVQNFVINVHLSIFDISRKDVTNLSNIFNLLFFEKNFIFFKNLIIFQEYEILHKK